MALTHCKIRSKNKILFLFKSKYLQYINLIHSKIAYPMNYEISAGIGGTLLRLANFLYKLFCPQTFKYLPALLYSVV